MNRPMCEVTPHEIRIWLKSYRKKKQITLRQFSEVSGIPISRLSNVERGLVTTMRLNYLNGFARAAGYKRLSDFIRDLKQRAY